MRAPNIISMQRRMSPDAPGGGKLEPGLKAPHAPTEGAATAPVHPVHPMPPVLTGQELVVPAAATAIGSPTRWVGASEPVVFTNPITDESVRAEDITDHYLDTLLRAAVKELLSVQDQFFDRIAEGENPRAVAAWTQKNIFESGRVSALITHLKEAAAGYGTRIGAPHLDKIYIHRLTNRLTYIQGMIGLAEMGAMTPAKAASNKEHSKGYEAKSVASLLVEIAKVKKEVVIARKRAAGPQGTQFEFKVEPVGPEHVQIPLTAQQAFDLEEILNEIVLRNAEKYSDKKITLRFDSKERCYVVTNDGQFIPKDFDPFARAGERAETVRHIQGTGFGLASLLPLAEKNGWRITFTSEPGNTEFRVWI